MASGKYKILEKFRYFTITLVLVVYTTAIFWSEFYLLPGDIYIDIDIDISIITN